MSYYADEKCDIPDDVIQIFFARNNIRSNQFNEKQYNKFKAYLKCFIKSARM